MTDSSSSSLSLSWTMATTAASRLSPLLDSSPPFSRVPSMMLSQLEAFAVNSIAYPSDPVTHHLLITPSIRAMVNSFHCSLLLGSDLLQSAYSCFISEGAVDVKEQRDTCVRYNAATMGEDDLRDYRRAFKTMSEMFCKGNAAVLCDAFQTFESEWGWHKRGEKRPEEKDWKRLALEFVLAAPYKWEGKKALYQGRHRPMRTVTFEEKEEPPRSFLVRN